MGKLDEISVAIGGLQSDTANLSETFQQHCRDDDRRHDENISTLRGIQDEMRKLHDVLKPVAERVATMSPIVDGFQISRLKIAGGLSVVVFILMGVGWLVASIAGEVIKWVAAHIR